MNPDMPPKHSEQSLIELESLKQVLDLTGMLVVILNRNGQIAHFNSRSEHATALLSQDLLGKAMRDALICDTQRDRFQELFEQVLSGQSADYEGFWQTREPGKYICVHSTISAVPALSSETEWITITGINITEKKRTEQALRRSEAQLRAIHDAAVDGIITIDESGVIRELNKAAAGVFGYTIQELIGQNVSILMPSPHAREHDRYIKNYLDTGDAKIIGIGRKVIGLRKDGMTFPHYLAVSEIDCTDKSGQRLFTGIVRDISERKRIEEAAHVRLTEHAHASRLAALGEMASGIAHELNQPLTAIVSFADASKRLLKGGAERIGLVDETLSQIAQQGERAGNIIRRLREFVRKGNVERQLISISNVIEDVLNMLDHDLRMQQVEVIRHFEKDAPNIRADKLQIEQVLLNLVRNAIDAMEACRTRTLTITVETDERSIIVQVSDSGPGFNNQQAAQLFDAFYTTKRNGTGLGLSISHSIIAAHGGELTANSDLDGATFRFSLPLK